MQSSLQVKSVTTIPRMIILASADIKTGRKSKIGKLTYRLSPLRKVAKSAKISLNRYWGLFSQLYGNSATGTGLSTNSTIVPAATTFAKEMEENRLNEILEAESFASSQDSLNSQHEEDLMSYESDSASSSSEPPPIRGFVRQRCYYSHVHPHSLQSSFPSSIDYFENEMGIFIMRSVAV